MRNDNLKGQTKKFALEVIRLTQSLPRDRASDVLGNQWLRAGTSVGANYRSACRAKSRADFISKMGTVEEEADESTYWMELMSEANLIREQQIHALFTEADELLSLVVSSINTAKRNQSSSTENTKGATGRTSLAPGNFAPRTPNSAFE